MRAEYSRVLSFFRMYEFKKQENALGVEELPGLTERCYTRQSVFARGWSLY